MTHSFFWLLLEKIRVHKWLFALAIFVKVCFVLFFALLFGFFFQKILFQLLGAVQVMQSDQINILSLTNGTSIEVALTPETIETMTTLSRLNMLFSDVVVTSVWFYVSVLLLWLVFASTEWFLFHRIIRKNKVLYGQFLFSFFGITIVVALLFAAIVVLSFWLLFQNMFSPFSFVSNTLLFVGIGFLVKLLIYFTALSYAHIGGEESFLSHLFSVSQKKEIILGSLFFFAFAFLCGFFFYDQVLLGTFWYATVPLTIFIVGSTVYQLFLVWFVDGDEHRFSGKGA